MNPNPNRKRDLTIAAILAAIVIGGGAMFLSGGEPSVAVNPTPSPTDAPPASAESTPDASAPSPTPTASAIPATTSPERLSVTPTAVASATPDCDHLLGRPGSDVQAWCECAASGQCDVSEPIGTLYERFCEPPYESQESAFALDLDLDVLCNPTPTSSTHAGAMRVRLRHRADAGRVRHVPLPVPARQPRGHPRDRVLRLSMRGRRTRWLHLRLPPARLSTSRVSAAATGRSR